MSRFEGVGLMTSLTASQMSSAKSSSVPVKLSGEYSNWKSVPETRVRQRLDLLGGADRNLRHALAVGPEDHFALQGRGRVVEVDDDLLRASDGLERALDQFRAALGQHLDRDIIGDRAGLDDRANEVEVGLRGGGKGDLDLLEPHVRQQPEHAVLAFDAHRLDQRLIAVAEVDRAPYRRFFDDPRGPLAVRQDDGRVSAVFLSGHVCHDEPWEDLGRPGCNQRAERACRMKRRMRNSMSRRV